MKHIILTKAERIRAILDADTQLQISSCLERIANNYRLATSHQRDIVKIVKETEYHNFNTFKQKLIDQAPYCVNEDYHAIVVDFMQSYDFRKMSDAKKIEFTNFHLKYITRAAVRLSYIRAILVTTLDIDVEKQMSYAPTLEKRTKLQFH